MNIPRTLVSLTTLQTSLAWPMAQVPNQVGYRILAVLKTNKLAVPLRVEKRADGSHYLVDQFNAHAPTSLFSGWIRDLYHGGKTFEQPATLAV